MMNHSQTLYAYISTFLMLTALSIPAQAQTYSPYTPAQINEFNHQPLAPPETPAGPIYLNNQEPPQQPQSTLERGYFSQPRGEQEAEAQEMGSATPFTPIPSTFAF
jgi:hypothetical protein